MKATATRQMIIGSPAASVSAHPLKYSTISCSALRFLPATRVRAWRADHHHERGTLLFQARSLLLALLVLLTSVPPLLARHAVLASVLPSAARAGATWRPAHARIGALWAAAPPRRLDVVSVPATATVSQRVTAEIYQGVENGRAPRGGTLIWLNYGDGSYEDRYWPALYAREFHLQIRHLTLTAALAEAAGTIARARRITRYVVWDPALPATIDIASTIAGIDHVLAIDPADETTGLNLKGLGYQRVLDLRGRFHSRGQAYAWALAHLAADTTRQAIAIQGVGDHGEDGPSSGARDYAVAARLFQFSVPPADRLYDRVLAAFPPETVVFGYDPTNQNAFTYKDSVRGDVGLNTALARNLSCHSAFRPVLNDRQPNPDPATVQVNPTKVYLAFSISDGDAIGLNARFYTTHGGGDPARHEYPGLWRDPDRGRIPLGWGISSVLAQLQRGVLRELYAERTPNDYFVSWLPGGFYDYHALPAAVRPDVLAWNRATMEDAELRVGWTYDTDRGGHPVFSAAEAAAYVNSVDSLGWVQGYHDDAAYLHPTRFRDPLFVGRQPRPFLFNAVDAQADHPGNVEFKINRMTDLIARRPLFLTVNFVVWHVRTLADLLAIWHDLQRQHPGRYELVTPGQLMALQGHYLRHGGARVSPSPLYPAAYHVGHS
jgi:hypothetical protein